MQRGGSLKCSNGHDMFMRYTPFATRGGSGQNVHCDLCRTSKDLNDITTEGIFKCSSTNCDYDVCRTCGLKNGGIFVSKSALAESKDKVEDEDSGLDNCGKYLLRICREME